MSAVVRRALLRCEGVCCEGVCRTKQPSRHQAAVIPSQPPSPHNHIYPHNTAFPTTLPPSFSTRWLYWRKTHKQDARFSSVVVLGAMCCHCRLTWIVTTLQTAGACWFCVFICCGCWVLYYMLYCRCFGVVYVMCWCCGIVHVHVLWVQYNVTATTYINHIHHQPHAHPYPYHLHTPTHPHTLPPQSRSALRAVFSTWSLSECRAWMEHNLGVALQLEEETGKLFPASNSAQQVRDALLGACETRGVTVR